MNDLTLDELDVIATETMIRYGIHAMVDRHIYNREAHRIKLDAFRDYAGEDGYAIYYDRPGGFKTQKAIIT